VQKVLNPPAREEGKGKGKKEVDLKEKETVKCCQESRNFATT
jgi:hypothetical protein